MKSIYKRIKKIILEKKIFLRNFLSYLMFSVLSTVIGIINIIYLTRALTPESYANEGICYGIIYFLVPLISFSSNGLTAINIIDFSQEKYFEYKRKYLSFGIVLFISISIFTLGIYYYSFRNQLINGIFILIVSFITYISEMNDTELIQNKKANSYGLIKIFLNLFKLLLSVVFISLVEMSWYGRLLAILLAEIIFAIIRVRYLTDKKFKFYFELNFEDIKSFVIYGMPIMISIGGGWIMSESQRFVVLNNFSMKEVGYYTVATRIGMLITILNVALLNTVYPITFAKLKRKVGYHFVYKLTFIYFGVLSIISVIVISILYTFSDLILGKQYTDGKHVIILLIIGYVFSSLYKVPSLVFEYYKENVLRTVLVYVSALIGLAVAYLGINKLGIISPAVGMLFSYLILTFLYLIYSSKIMKREKVA